VGVAAVEDREDQEVVVVASAADMVALEAMAAVAVATVDPASCREEVGTVVATEAARAATSLTERDHESARQDQGLTCAERAFKTLLLKSKKLWRTVRKAERL
jgi:hypothetical protein